MKHRLIPPQCNTSYSTYNQSAWSLASHARLEVVEEEEEADKVQPEQSSNVPSLKVSFHGPSEMEYERSDVTRVESSEAAESAVRQDTETLDIIPLHDSEGDTPRCSISKSNVPLTPKLKNPVIHDMLNSPASGMFFRP